jgi:hypothetical protein
VQNAPFDSDDISIPVWSIKSESLKQTSLVSYHRLFSVALETELYEVLGISPTATEGTPCGTLLLVYVPTRHFFSDDIKKAYRLKVLIFALFPSRVNS